MGQERAQIRLQYDKAKENQKQQQEWESAENAVDRAWQESQWLNQFLMESGQQEKMFDKETQRWIDQFNLQNSYNSPRSEVARLMAAGINPSAIAGSSSLAGNSSASVSAGSGSSPSPSGLQGKSVTPAPFGTVAGISSNAAMFSSVAQLNDSLSKLAKAGSDISVDQRKIGSVVDNLVADTGAKQASASLTSTLNNIQSLNGDAKAKAEIQSLLKQADAASAQSDLSKAQKLYNEALTRLTNTDQFIKSDSYPQVLSNLRAYGKTLESLDTLNKARTHEAEASASASYSRAGLDDALRATEDALRSGKVDRQVLDNASVRLANQHQRMDNKLFFDTYGDQVRQIAESAKQAGYITEETLQRARKAIADANFIEVEQMFRMIDVSSRSVRNISSASSASK